MWVWVCKLLRIYTRSSLLRLQAYKQTQQDPKVLINGDENALFAQVRYVVDEVRKAGITKVLIETRIRPAS